jgi:hypothetical protein
VGDWLLMCGAMVLSASGWWTVHRIWSQREDATTGPIQIIPASSKAGANAARLPMALTFTAVSMGMAADAIVTGNPNGDSPIATIMSCVAIAALLLTGWMWLFAWPRFLVPPAFRGQSGWLATAVRSVWAKVPTHRH